MNVLITQYLVLCHHCKAEVIFHRSECYVFVFFFWSIFSWGFAVLLARIKLIGQNFELILMLHRSLSPEVRLSYFLLFQMLGSSSGRLQLPKCGMRINNQGHQGKEMTITFLSMQNPEGKIQLGFIYVLTWIVYMPHCSDFMFDSHKPRLGPVWPHGRSRKSGLSDHPSSIPIAFCMTFGRWYSHPPFLIPLPLLPIWQVIYGGDYVHLIPRKNELG